MFHITYYILSQNVSFQYILLFLKDFREIRFIASFPYQRKTMKDSEDDNITILPIKVPF